MRGFAGLLAYLVGVSAIITVGIAGLMALQSPSARTPSAPITSAVSHNEYLGTGTQQTIAVQKKARPDHKHKIVHVIRERTHEAPSTNEASYGYAQEPRRRIDPGLFLVVRHYSEASEAPPYLRREAAMPQPAYVRFQR